MRECLGSFTYFQCCPKQKKGPGRVHEIARVEGKQLPPFCTGLFPKHFASVVTSGIPVCSSFLQEQKDFCCCEPLLVR